MCNCIEEIDKRLAAKDLNTKLGRAWSLETGMCSVILVTRKVDDKVRKKPMEIYPPFCPFCGEPYAEPKPTVEDQPKG